MRGSRSEIEMTVESIERRAEALAQLAAERAANARALRAAAEMRTYRAGVQAECAAAIALCRVFNVPTPTTKVQHDRRKGGTQLLAVGVFQKPDSDPEAD